MTGLGKRELPGNLVYAAIHYSADPEKNPEWAARVRAERGNRQFRAEYEMYEDVYDGEPVYEAYRDDLHAPPKYREAQIPYIPGSALFGGWDCGTTLQPAFVLDMATPNGQLASVLEVLPEGAESMATFAPKVARAIEKWLPGGSDMVEHWGDATVVTRSGATGETARQVARQKAGIDIQPSSNALQGRLSAVNRLLVEEADEGVPRYVVCGAGCPVLRQGFQGAYRYQEHAKSEGIGPGKILLEPLKNGFSHIHDAKQYAAMAFWRHFDKGRSKFARDARRRDGFGKPINAWDILQMKH